MSAIVNMQIIVGFSKLRPSRRHANTHPAQTTVRAEHPLFPQNAMNPTKKANLSGSCETVPKTSKKGIFLFAIQFRSV
jgi:hypothetical protein